MLLSINYPKSFYCRYILFYVLTRSILVVNTGTYTTHPVRPQCSLFSVCTQKHLQLHYRKYLYSKYVFTFILLPSHHLYLWSGPRRRHIFGPLGYKYIKYTLYWTVIMGTGNKLICLQRTIKNNL